MLKYLYLGFGFLLSLLIIPKLGEKEDIIWKAAVYSVAVLTFLFWPIVLLVNLIKPRG